MAAGTPSTDWTSLQSESMGMNTGSGPGGLKSEINVTPLVDVVLVLLIIFMVVTPMMSRGKSVALPAGVHPAMEDGTPDDPFVVSLTADRRLFFEAEPELAVPALPSRLRQALKEQPSRGIRLKADESLQMGDVRTVLQSIRASGARSVLLAVQEPIKR